MSTQWRLLICTGMAAIAVLHGCNRHGRSTPVARSLTDMAYETRAQKGQWFAHSEIISLNGLMPMSDVGVVLHYSNERGFFPGTVSDTPLPPSTVIGISRDHSFRLVGTSRSIPTMDDLWDVRDALSQVQDDTAATIATSMVIGSLLEEGRQADATSPRSLHAAALESLEARLQSATESLARSRRRLQAATRKDGLIVARWQVGDSARGSMGARPFATFEASSQDDGQGFIILGGVRISALYIGDDFKQMLARLSPSDEISLPWGAIPTYQLAARNKVFVADRSITDAIGLELQLHAAALSVPSLAALQISQVSASAAYRSYLALGSSSSLGEIDWERKPFCFVSGSDLLIEGNRGRATLRTDSLSGWQVVITHLIHPDQGLPEDLLAVYKEEFGYPEFSSLWRREGSGRSLCTPDDCNEFGSLQRTYEPLSPPQ